MKPIVSVAEMAAIDAQAQAQVGLEALVARAGAALARSVLARLGGAYGRRVVVVAGRGHNGDDGRVAAEHLRRRGVRVTVVEAAGRGTPGPGRPLSPPAEPGRPLSPPAEPGRPRRRPAGPVLEPCHLVVDAAYGTGFSGDYRAPAVPPGAVVVAADIPSGVQGDTGEAGPGAVVADTTVTFAALKPGLVMGEGRAHSGRVEVADIGLAIPTVNAHLVEDGDVAGSLAGRPREAHKWQSAVYIAAGSPGMMGSASLCSRAAMRAGAGMVRLGVPGAGPQDLPASEVVARGLPAVAWADEVLPELGRCRSLAMGPGLGRSEETAAAVRRLLAESPLPVVVDADGLNALGEVDQVADLVRARERAGCRAPVVLTPHAGEYARLAGSKPSPDHLQAARDLAARSRATVLLKGSTTVVASPDGRALLVTSGSSRLATAGTGDVLTGIIAAFLAEGLDALLAAALAAHVHGRAAGLGSVGLVAGDLIELVPRWLAAWGAGEEVLSDVAPTPGPAGQGQDG